VVRTTVALQASGTRCLRERPFNSSGSCSEHASKSDGDDHYDHYQGCESQVPGDGRFQRIVEPGGKLAEAVVKGQGGVGDVARDGHRAQQTNHPAAAAGEHNDSSTAEAAAATTT
jgi:hypothetical protein